jgi:Response regulator receiver domain
MSGKYIRSLVQQRAEFRVVGQASDGTEAVELARRLQPDVILMDIGLPKLSGIDAAKQILTLDSDVKFYSSAWKPLMSWCERRYGWVHRATFISRARATNCCSLSKRFLVARNTLAVIWAFKRQSHDSIHIWDFTE